MSASRMKNCPLKKYFRNSLRDRVRFYRPVRRPPPRRRETVPARTRRRCRRPSRGPSRLSFVSLWHSAHSFDAPASFWNAVAGPGRVQEERARAQTDRNGFSGVSLVGDRPSITHGSHCTSALRDVSDEFGNVDGETLYVRMPAALRIRKILRTGPADIDLIINDKLSQFQGTCLLGMCLMPKGSARLSLETSSSGVQACTGEDCC